MRSRVGLLLLAGATVTALVLGACGGGGAATATPVKPAPTTGVQATTAPTGPAATATSAPRPTSAPTATTAPPPTATAAPVPQGTLNVAVALGNQVMIPDNGGSASGSGGFGYMSLMYDPVLGSTNDGKIDPARGMAASWSANADSTVWTLKIRDGVSFHNGEKATSEDLRYLLQFSIRDGSLSGKAGPLKKGLKSFEAPDASTLVVTLTARDIYWPVNYLSSIAPASVPFLLTSSKHLQTAGVTQANKQPIGTGPYKFTSLTQGDRVVLDASAKHWYFGVPRTQRVNFIDIPEESTRVSLLKTGAADLAPISTASVKQMTGGLQSFVQTDTQIVTYQFREQFQETYPNYGKNPFADVRVRQALHYYAIDRKTLVDSFMNGAGAPSMNYPILSLEPAYKPIPVPAYDLAKAKQLLADAGYPNGFAIDYIVFTPPLFPEGTDVAEAFAVTWEKVGLKVNRLPMSQGTWRDQMFANVGKSYYTKPTVVAFYAIPNAVSATPYALNTHTADSPWVMNRDAVGNKLAQEWAASPSQAEYVKRGQAYLDWEVENITTFEPIFTTGAKYGATAKIPKTWTPGRDTGSARFEYAVAQR